MEITLTVNGIKHTIEINPEEKLLSILRERLQLTGAKDGCSQGHCGSCTVVMNQKAVKSCLIRADRLDNANIITIEGISPQIPNGKLNPIQQAFIDTTAVQCGFCTPGIIMELYALFTFNTVVSEEDIKKALEGHLCRCTGYKPILDAALLAKQRLKK